MSLVGDLSSGWPLLSRSLRAGRPAASDAGLVTEVAALAALLAEVVQFAGRAAIFPGQWEALADQAREYDSVRTALLAAQQRRTVSTSRSALTSPTSVDPYPSWDTITGARSAL